MSRTLVSLGGSVWSQSLRKIGMIDLPGPKGQRFDYLTMDDEDHFLLSAHLGPGILYVIDVQKEQTGKGNSRRPRDYRTGVRSWPSQGLHFRLGRGKDRRCRSAHHDDRQASGDC